MNKTEIVFLTVFISVLATVAAMKGWESGQANNKTVTITSSEKSPSEPKRLSVWCFERLQTDDHMSASCSLEQSDCQFYRNIDIDNGHKDSPCYETDDPSFTESTFTDGTTIKVYYPTPAYCEMERNNDLEIISRKSASSVTSIGPCLRVKSL